MIENSIVETARVNDSIRTIMNTVLEEIKATKAHAPGSLRRSELARVIQALDAMCDDLGAGARIATHSELMRRIDASERTVLRALDEMQRAGRIVRRHGSGTFVAHRSSIHTPSPNASVNETKAIVAIARPDQAFFDRCIELLYGHARSVDLDLVCRLIGAETSASAILSGINHASGYIVFSYNYAPLAEQLQEAGHRVVIVGAPPTNVVPNVPCVHSNHQQGGLLAANHLLQLGHERLVFVSDSPEPKALLRWQGLERAASDARRAGKSVSIDVLQLETLLGWGARPEEAAAYFKRDGAPTAMIAWNDNQAIQIISTLALCGMRVPDDLSLIGYDAIPEGELLKPKLSTVDSMIHQQLDAAVQLLAQPVPARAPYTVVALPTLVPRGTTAAPKS